MSDLWPEQPVKPKKQQSSVRTVKTVVNDLSIVFTITIPIRNKESIHAYSHRHVKSILALTDVLKKEMAKL